MRHDQKSFFKKEIAALRNQRQDVLQHVPPLARLKYRITTSPHYLKLIGAGGSLGSAATGLKVGATAGLMLGPGELGYALAGAASGAVGASLAYEKFAAPYVAAYAERKQNREGEHPDLIKAEELTQRIKLAKECARSGLSPQTYMSTHVVADNATPQNPPRPTAQLMAEHEQAQYAARAERIAAPHLVDELEETMPVPEPEPELER